MAEIKLYLDEHIPLAVAQGLRRRGIDVQTTQEADNSGSPDQRQILFACQDGRVIVTFDSDFLSLATGGIRHCGIIFCSASKYSIGELISVLVLADEILVPEEMLNHVEFI